MVKRTDLADLIHKNRFCDGGQKRFVFILIEGTKRSQASAGSGSPPSFRAQKTPRARQTTDAAQIQRLKPA